MDQYDAYQGSKADEINKKKLDYQKYIDQGQKMAEEV